MGVSVCCAVAGISVVGASVKINELVVACSVVGLGPSVVIATGIRTVVIDSAVVAGSLWSEVVDI